MPHRYAMSLLDQILIALFLIVTLVIGLRLKSKNTTHADYLLGGRALTLPAFVATTVSTWYGGILGVGEYGWTYGISNWLVFGVPYYLGALLFALILSKRARNGESLTLPHRLGEWYGPAVGRLAAALVFLTSLPASYMLIMGTLTGISFGLSQLTGIVLTAIFIVAYLWRGGFSAITKTDVFQCVMMFGGFILLCAFLATNYGTAPLATVPETHWSPTGGQPVTEILVWYVIALSTLAEPNFFQRAFAAKTPEIAKNGMLISIACWIGFDAMTTICALYARALLPELQDPLYAFPELAMTVLPTGLLGIFFVGMFATVLSSLDSNLFTVATTFGHDFFSFSTKKAQNSLKNTQKTIDDNDTSKNIDEKSEQISSKNCAISDEKITKKRTQLGLLISASLAVFIALLSKSVVEIWKVFGSVSAAALLIPILSTYYPKLRMTRRAVFVLMATSTVTTLFWFGAKKILGDYPLDLRPLFAGAIIGIIVFIIDMLKIHVLSQKSN